MLPTLESMHPRRLSFWLLATAGVAVGHFAAYLIAHPDRGARELALAGHDYLPAAMAFVVPLGTLAALVIAVRTARSLGMAGQLSWSRLAAAQCAIFAVQEVAERLIDGQHALAAGAERAVWVGFVAQSLVALLATKAVDWARRVVRFALGAARSTSAAPVRTPVVLHPEPWSCWRLPVVAVGVRAPPVVGSPH